MNQRIGLTLLATGVLAIAIVGSATRGVAQDGSIARAIKLVEAGGKKARGEPRAVAPRSTAPRQVVMPKTVTQQRGIAPKTVTPRRAVAPATVVPGRAAPRAVSPSGPGLRAIGTRSTGAIAVGGRNYSVWRGTHRVRYGGRWATLAAIGALGVVVYAGARYYPYAYVSAPGPYCTGVTEDGCLLQWQEVLTLEGPTVLQCVAYCPWQ